MPDELTDSAAPVIRLRPDFRPTAFLSRTDKTLLIAGDCEDGPAVAKLLTSPEPLWAEKIGKTPRAGSTLADDPAGGFASPRQLREWLSAEAVRRHGEQVRPGLPRQQQRAVGSATGAAKRKGLRRGRH